MEHLENELGRWVLAEYRNSYRIAGDLLLITGIEIPGIPSTSKRFHEISDPSRVVILDPQAWEELKPEDLLGRDGIVIGGILGSHPPLGRTRRLLSERFPQAAKRNIGRHQFSIDGSVYVALQIIRGKRLSDIPFAVNIRIKRRLGPVEHEIHLPYAYPLVGGRPLISEELINLLAGSNGYVVEFSQDTEEPC